MNDLEEYKKLNAKEKTQKIFFIIITVIVTCIFVVISIMSFAIVDPGEGERNCTICGHVLPDEELHDSCPDDEFEL